MRWRAGLLGAALLAAGDRAATDIVVPLPGGRLAIGRLALAPTSLLVAPAHAQGAATVVLDDVRWTGDGLSVVAPRVEVAGTALSRDDLASLLDAASPLPPAERVARLSAQGVRIPELRVEQDTLGGRQVTLYRDLRAGPIVQGRVATLEAAGATLTASGPAGEGHGSYGPLTATDLDLAAMARVLGERAEGAPLVRLYGRFGARDIVFTDPRGIVVRVAAVEGSDFSARPLKQSWRDAGRALAGVDPKRATPQARAAFMGTAADVLDGFAIGALALTGLEVAGANGRDGGTAQVARLAYDGAAHTLRAEKLAFGAGNGARGTLETVALSGLSLDSTLAALRRHAASPETAADPAAMRDLAPRVEGLRLDGLALDWPAAGPPPAPGAHAAPGTPAAPAAPPGASWKLGLRTADLTTQAPEQGAPTGGRLAVDGLTLSLPANGRAGALEPVAALGYRDLDLAGVLDSRWSPATGELTLRDLTLSGRDMGKIRLSGQVAGLSRDVLDPDTAVSGVALLAATAKTLALEIENSGLFERIVAQQARAQSLTPEALRREYGTAAAMGIPAILGNAPAARALGQAVARFVAKPGRLALTATAKDPAGFGVADVSSAGSPAAILDRLNVTATAE